MATLITDQPIASLPPGGQRDDAAGQSTAEASCRRCEAEQLQLRLRHGADGSRSTSSRSTRTVAIDLSSLCAPSGRAPAWRARPMIQVASTQSLLGALHSGRLRPDRGHRHAHLQRPGHRRHRQQRASPVSPGSRCDIVDPDGPDVPDGETGEIVARGRVLTNGYHDRRRSSERRAPRRAVAVAHQRPRPARGRRVHHLSVAPLTRIVKSAADEHLSRPRSRDRLEPATRACRKPPSSACPTPAGPSRCGGAAVRGHHGTRGRGAHRRG